MTTAHVSHTGDYDSDTASTSTHTMTIHDERSESGSVTIWAYPKPYPQSMGIAAVVHIGQPAGQESVGPGISVYASQREAMNVYFVDGKLVLDTKGLSLSKNPHTGLYELEL